MKALLTFILFFSTLLISGQNKSSSYGFIENKGQIIDQKGKPNPNVKYLLNTNGLNVQLRENGFSYDVYEVKKKEINSIIPLIDFESKNPIIKSNYSIHRVDIDFLNTNLNTKIIGEQKSSGFNNYFNLLHNVEGITHVYNYQKVIYKNLYANIDVVFFIPDDHTKVFEYNFIIKPGGKISDIQFKINGVKNELFNNKIKMNLRFGQMDETIPLSWIELDESNSELVINYKKIKRNTYGFQGELNSSSNTIIIDPVPIRLWGTYYGGMGYETSGTLNVDSNNNTILSGGTGSTTNIASAGPNISGYDSGSAYISKFDTNGEFLWGSYYPFGTSLVLDSQDNMYLYGNVLNINPFIPSPGCHQPLKDQYNSGYLIKLNNLGIKQWGTYYGGNQNDYIRGLSVDTNGNIYIVGETNSTDNFSTPGAFQMEKASPGYLSTGFIAKFDSIGTRIWSTFYGGELADGFTACSISSDGHLYAIGVHNSINASSNITTPGSYQPAATQFGGMIVKFNLNGNRIWGTFIADRTYLFGACLKDDYIVIYGRGINNYGLGTPGTMHENFVEPLPQGSILSSGNNYTIIKFNLQTQQYIWGTYFFEQILSLDLDSSGNIFFSGYTGINNGLTTPDAFMPIKTNYQKSYLIKLNPLGQKIWGTYYGGNLAEQMCVTKIDLNNDIYLYGNTNGSTTGIATDGAHQSTLGSNPDTYIVKFRDCLSSTNVTSNTPTCIGSNLELIATGGTNYLWTGPNGFTSTLQNPVISNVNSSHSGQYSCEITGTVDCDNTVTIDVFVGDTQAPVPNLSNLPVINGDCNTVITNIPTANDNCSGIIIATTTSSLDFSTSGNYTITWNYDDGNGNTFTQTQNIVINPIATPIGNSQQTFCIQDNATLNDFLINGQNITWYDSQSNGNSLANNTILQNAVTYYASQSINGCESNRIAILAIINNTPPVTGTINQNFCSTENATLQSIVVNGTAILWYDSITSTTPLPNSTILINNTTYYATQTLNGCESNIRLAVTINLINTLNATNYSELICDDLNDGKEIIDLTSYNTELIASNGNIFNYYNSFNGAENQITSEEIANNTNFELLIGNRIIYVRIDSPNTCFQIVELNLTLFSKPIIEINDIMPICDGNSIVINAGNGFYSYIWSTGETTPSIIVSQPGNYNVTVTENHGSLICSSTKNFTVVLSNPATITNIETKDWTTSENIIQIAASGLGNYEYSLDNINFQDSNLFTNLPSGEYTVFVRDKNDCGTVDQKVYLLMYPLFFTPNGDGYNDKWKIKFSEIEPNLTVIIFDRYGKFIKQLGANSEGWDGTYSGNLLPSNDYWFVVTRENGKEYRGHFSLKR
ncbi:T9SS type B sorting domain-containing protein [Flavobacterium sp.]|uniref:DUF7948 domain-containing protein n=1 Tax=Flavobacterium sp. TaxID=239 RepID=UPI0025C1ED10|nr:T9SS type B sorting domain-containing protein [Flavobacterium sp.]MBA4154863.1 hypothetical protein [Flavobacterium sp.]